MCHSKNRRIGFTLIELLVVISIIAILMAIMMPALRKAREQAQKVVCSSRLKDIGLTVGLYTTDNNNKLMDAGFAGKRWDSKLVAYYDRDDSSVSGGKYDYKLFRCPTQDKFTENVFDDKYGEDFKALGLYGYNEFFTNYGVIGSGSSYTFRSGYQPHNWRRITDIIQPATLPLFADLDWDGYEPAGVEYGGGWYLSGHWPHPKAYEFGWQNGLVQTRRHHRFGPAPNHGERCNYLMADNHIEGKELWPWPQDPSSGGREAFHPKRNLDVTP